MPWQSSRINMSHGLFPVSKEKGQGYPTLFQGGEEFNQEHMNCTGALLGPKDKQKTHSLQTLSANEKWRRFYIIIKKTGVEGTCLWTAKIIRSQKDYQTQSHSGLTEQLKGLWLIQLHFFGTGFKIGSIIHYVICFPLGKSP